MLGRLALIGDWISWRVMSWGNSWRTTIFRGAGMIGAAKHRVVNASANTCTEESILNDMRQMRRAKNCSRLFPSSQMIPGFIAFSACLSKHRPKAPEPFQSYLQSLSVSFGSIRRLAEQPIRHLGAQGGGEDRIDRCRFAFLCKRKRKRNPCWPLSRKSGLLLPLLPRGASIC